MQEWIIAMLVISLLLIFRDMAKTILTGQMSKKEEPFAPGESHPQKEKVERYAASFQKLADTFYGMPYRKEYLSSGQIDAILKDTNEEMCSRCYHREICWGENSGFLKQGGEAMIRAMEEGDEEAVDLRQIYTVSGNSQRAFSEGKTESGMEQPHDRKQAGSGTAADRDIPDHGNGGRRYL